MESEMQESDIIERAERIMATDLPQHNIGKAWLRHPLRRKLELAILIPTAPLALSIMAYVGILIARIDKFDPIISINLGWPPDEREITVAKLQTMIAKPEIDKALASGEYRLNDIKINGDPRVTKFGKILRKISIDEVPQIFNVIAGDMNLVGLRACNIAQWENEIFPFREQYPYKSVIDAIREGYIKPSLTGLDGILGRAHLDIATRFQLMDLYIQKASWIADLRIIGLTFPAIMSQRGAY